MPINRSITRFYALDALRGIAALFVVIWHYKHFGHSPLKDWLAFPYTSGWLMVDLFFCLSGFIFFWKYSEAIYEKSIGFKKFIFLRFSRLYPLHLATLLIVGAGQYFIYLSDKKYFIFLLNDLKHFLLNVLFISSWGFEVGLSFNGPTWSVSIEVLLYLIFYLCCFRLKPTNFIWPLALIIFGWILFSNYFSFFIFHTMLGRGLFSFFAGGLTYQIFRRAASFHQKAYISLVAFVGFVALTFWVTVDSTVSNLYTWYYEIVFLIGYPSTVLFLAFLDVEKIFAYVFKKLAYLGDISYGTYLLHFPVQIFLYLAAKQIQIDFSKTGTFLLYLALTIGLAAASHKFFEVPCQRYLRSKFPTK